MNDKHTSKESVKRKNYKVIDCADCGYWHVYPVPTEDELNAFYESTYYETLGNNRSMTDKVRDPDGFFAMQYDDRLRHLTRLLPSDLPRKILDLGAGYGDFLRFMKKNLWETQGLEISKQTWESIKDRDELNIRQGGIDRLLNLGFKKASVVTFINVLEHIRNPKSALKIVRENLLLPKGLICIIVPNDFSLLQNLIMKSLLKDNPQRQYYWIEPPEHLNYWSPESIKRFLGMCGFKILYFTGDFPMEIFPLMGEDYITYPEIGKDTHLKRVRFEKYFHENKTLDLKDKLFKSFADIGIGRSMIIFASVKE